MPKPKKPSAPDVRLYSITHLDGLREVLCVPATARLTIYAGKAPDERLKTYTSQLAPAGQLRIYEGTRLIAFFPAICNFYELDTVSHHPIALPPQVPASFDVEASDAKWPISSFAPVGISQIGSAKLGSAKLTR